MILVLSNIVWVILIMVASAYFTHKTETTWNYKHPGGEDKAMAFFLLGIVVAGAGIVAINTTNGAMFWSVLLVLVGLIGFIFAIDKIYTFSYNFFKNRDKP